MKNGLLIVLVTVLAIGGATLTAFGEDQVRGVTDDKILVGQWGPQTGPAAPWGAVARGTGVFFKMINEEGGIHGRKLEYFLRDDAYQPSKTKAIAKEFVEEIGVFAVVCGVGTSTGMAARDYLMENEVPWVGPAAGSTHWVHPPRKYLFGLYPLYIHESYLLAKYAAEDLKKKKIAFFYQNDDFGKQGLQGAKKYMKEAGMELAAEVPVEVTDTDLKSHALKLKKAGCDAVILWVFPKHAAILLGTSKAMGFEPQWVAVSALSDSRLMYKITKGLWKDVVYGNFLDLESPLVKKYWAAAKKYAPQEKHYGIFFLAGFLFAEPFVEGLRRAGEDLNKESFVEAMNSIKHWNDWLGHDCTFSPDDRQGMKSIYIAKCGEGGKPIKVSDWMTYTEDTEE